MRTLLTDQTDPSHPELQPRPFRVVARQGEAPAPSPPHSGDEDLSSWGCWGAGLIGWGPLGQARGGPEEELSPGLLAGGPGWRWPGARVGQVAGKGHLKGTASCRRPQGRALCLEPDGGSEWVLQLPRELERALQVPTDYSASFGQLEWGGGGTDVSAGGVDFPSAKSQSSKDLWVFCLQHSLECEL